MRFPASLIQGLALPGLPFDRQTFVFLSIVDIERASAWVRNVRFTSTLELLADEARRAAGRDGVVSHTQNLLLSTIGCKTLGQVEPLRADPAFARADSELGQLIPVDAVLVLGHDEVDDDALIGAISPRATGFSVQSTIAARRLRDERGRSTERFGFLDPVRQPRVVGVCDEFPQLSVSVDKGDGAAPVPVSDFFWGIGEGRDAEDCRHGAFAVLWKLRQDPRRFRDYIADAFDRLRAADEVHLSSSDEMKQLLMGAHPTYTMTGGHTEKAVAAQTQPLLRRGIPFEAGADCGLVFLSFQKRYADFVELYRRLIGSNDIPWPGFGADVLLGSAPRAEEEQRLLSVFHRRELDAPLATIPAPVGLVHSEGFLPLFCAGLDVLQTMGARSSERAAEN